MVLGNDVSSFQGDINFDVYKDNTNFFICKATEGNGFIDPKLSRNQSEARRVGLPLGYYHFARPDLNNAPEDEARWFLKTIGQLRSGEVLVLDYEANWSGNVVDWCHRWLNFVYQATGCRPLIYLNQSQTQGFDWKPVVIDNYGLWVAAYTYDPNNNNFQSGAWPSAVMQQWSNSQKVPAIVGGVDGDVFFGDINAFKKYGYKSPDPVPPPTPPQPPQPPQESDKEKKYDAFVAAGFNSVDDVNTKLDQFKTMVDRQHQIIVDYQSQASVYVDQIKTLKDQLAHSTSGTNNPPSGGTTVPHTESKLLSWLLGRTVWVLN